MKLSAAEAAGQGCTSRANGGSGSAPAPSIRCLPVGARDCGRQSTAGTRNASRHDCTDQERAMTSRFPADVCERMNGTEVFPAPAHPGDANALSKACFQGLSGI
jgi:hypothetical protein